MAKRGSAASWVATVGWAVRATASRPSFVAAALRSLSAEAGTMKEPAGMVVAPHLEGGFGDLDVDVLELIAQGDHVG